MKRPLDKDFRSNPSGSLSYLYALEKYVDFLEQAKQSESDEIVYRDGKYFATQGQVEALNKMFPPEQGKHNQNVILKKECEPDCLYCKPQPVKDEVREAAEKFLMYQKEYFPEATAPSYAKQVRWENALKKLEKALNESSNDVQG